MYVIVCDVCNNFRFVKRIVYAGLLHSCIQMSSLNSWCIAEVNDSR